MFKKICLKKEVEDVNHLIKSISVKNKKNMIIEPIKSCEFEFIFNEGLNPFYGLLPHLERCGVVERAGSWYTVEATGKKFQSAHLRDLIESGDEGVEPITILLKDS